MLPVLADGTLSPPRHPASLEGYLPQIFLAFPSNLRWLHLREGEFRVK